LDSFLLWFVEFFLFVKIWAFWIQVFLVEGFLVGNF
jgi:hypothetical protein